MNAIVQVLLHSNCAPNPLGIHRSIPFFRGDPFNYQTATSSSVVAGKRRVVVMCGGGSWVAHVKGGQLYETCCWTSSSKSATLYRHHRAIHRDDHDDPFIFELPATLIEIQFPF